ncbi:hypothetical protein DH96_02110 [Candidatus Phytoplasma oryzae]|uniref:Uncharacterized protein n=1 Tax=Candidatus Phytoplasma oryzae TaxID=203274 RepID=A0A328IIZ9_9MOLU|nr:hypothetical protein [Candidatus Phytoplasma oryzae]RAM57715.1 hypothetical protein DH96_02110 [Candidatus Phytoplasma oryzae]
MSKKSFFKNIIPSKKKQKITPKKSIYRQSSSMNPVKISIEQPMTQSTRQNNLWIKIGKIVATFLFWLPWLILLGALGLVLFKFFPEVYAAISKKGKEIIEYVVKHYNKYIDEPIKKTWEWLFNKKHSSKSTMWIVTIGTILTGLIATNLTTNMSRNFVLGGLKWISRLSFWGFSLVFLYKLYHLKDSKPSTTDLPPKPTEQVVINQIKQPTKQPDSLQQMDDFKKKILSP